MESIFLDYNGTTPIDPQVAEAMLPYIYEHFGNPSSSHAFGVKPKAAVEHARSQIAAMLGCQADEIFFTSGGTESNNHAIRGAVSALAHQGNHVITSAVEHPAVLEVCRFLEKHGAVITYLPVDGSGMVDPVDVENAITSDTVLISIMHANNEVGTIQPIERISEIAKRHRVLVHTDCAQSVGKIPVNVDDLGIDLLSIAGHKIYSPKGIGALYVRKGVQVDQLQFGAGQESGKRPGTENVIFSVALGEACALVDQNIQEYSKQMKAMRDRLESQILAEFPGARINGHPEQRLPNTSSLSFQGLKANEILDSFEFVAASAGAACHSDSITLSSVLEAMKLPMEFAMGTVRFSTGRYTTEEQIDQAADEVCRVVGRLTQESAAKV